MSSKKGGFVFSFFFLEGMRGKDGKIVLSEHFVHVELFYTWF